jgi:hypothetical protein
MKVATILLGFCVMAPMFGACSSIPQQCRPPEPVLDKLRAILSYRNKGTNSETTENFTVLHNARRIFLRHDNSAADSESPSKPVYVFEGTEQIAGLTCSSDATWVECINRWQAENPSVAQQSPGAEVALAVPCEFTLQIPPWRPSPDTDEKTRVAAQVLQELMEFGYSDLKTVYARDFNLNDPSLDIYYELNSGESGIQGCSFDSIAIPHCRGWHLYGQSPVDLVKKDILENPYRFFPPPIGKP